MVMTVYERMLKQWCDRLLELQITEKTEPEFYGGILCPSCGRIHGRCFEAMYPMLYLGKLTGEQKYIDGAAGLFSWSDNLYHQEGFFYNDTNSRWIGTTVFSAAQFGECLLDFGALLETELRRRIRERFEQCAAYLRNNIDRIGGNINYPLTCSYTMAVAHAVTGEKQYARKAEELAHRVRDYVTEDGLIFGEGHNWQELSPNGCRPVDIGYNVEESLPALLQYARMAKDAETEDFVTGLMGTHLEFMLPDGAWDNSFGTRNYKWSYWGSRTSDGCFAGYGLVDDPVFREAARRNLKLIQSCTCDGLLYGGPMFHTAGEPPCVHHTICHAKALAMLLTKAEPEQLTKLQNADEGATLPAENREGIRWFPSVRTMLLGKGDWRATITGYDVEYCRCGHPSGGAVSLLWHRTLGAVLVGTTGTDELVEPNNMQLLRNATQACLTLRIEYEEDGRCYRSINDKATVVQWREDADRITVEVTGTMTAADQTKGAEYRLQYELSETGLTVAAVCEREDSSLFLYPVAHGETAEETYFSPVGGMLAFRRGFPMRGDKGVCCKVEIVEEHLQIRELNPADRGEAAYEE